MLTLMSIVSELLRTIDVNSIIDDFARVKARWCIITGILYNTYFSRGGNFRYIREFGFCAKFSSREIIIHCAWNFAKFSSREFFLHAKIKH